MLQKRMNTSVVIFENPFNLKMSRRNVSTQQEDHVCKVELSQENKYILLHHL